MLIGSAAIAFVVAFAFRDVPNTAYPPAAAFTARMEAAYAAVVAGRSSVGDFTGPEGIFGGSFTAAPPIDLGGGAPPPQLYMALVGVEGGECYVIRWGPRAPPFLGVLAPGLPCEVGELLIQPDLFIRAASQSSVNTPLAWDAVLPVRSRQARWFVPVIGGALLVVLQGLIGISLAFLRSQPRRIPALPV